MVGLAQCENQPHDVHMPTICPTCNGDEEIESCPTHGGTNCPCVHAVEPCTDCLDGTTSEDTNDA